VTGTDVLEVDALLARAERETGLSDYGDPSLGERIEIVLDAEDHGGDAGEPPTLTPTPIPATAVRQVPPRDGVEVRCRFGDRWVTGFEVCEVIRFDDETRYRLRRRSDGSVLPTLFDEKDLRFFTTSFIEQ